MVETLRTSTVVSYPPRCRGTCDEGIERAIAKYRSQHCSPLNNCCSAWFSSSFDFHTTEINFFYPLLLVVASIWMFKGWNGQGPASFKVLFPLCSPRPLLCGCMPVRDEILGHPLLGCHLAQCSEIIRNSALHFLPKPPIFQGHCWQSCDLAAKAKRLTKMTKANMFMYVSRVFPWCKTLFDRFIFTTSHLLHFAILRCWPYTLRPQLLTF